MVSARRGLLGALCAGAALLAAAPTALADPPPNCTAADLAGVHGSVSTATSNYLFTHPEVNGFFTSLEGAHHDVVRDEVRRYLDSHPQVRNELNAIRQPLVDIRERCGGDIGQPALPGN